jgi:hypothetical protein
LYQGEWVNDRAHGKGQLLWPNGKKRYDGEFKDGLKHGYGYQYTAEGDKEFAGVFTNDKRDDGKTNAREVAVIEHIVPEETHEKKAAIKSDPKETPKNGQKTKDACCATF